MGRSPCCDKAHIHKGAWTKDEDDRLVAYIHTNGEGCWRSLPKAAGLLRCGKSCRLRWINYLRPGLKRGNFTEEEDELIINLHSHLGNKWSVIAGRLQGRTDNEIKNYWNTHIRRKLVSRGIDPATHRPIHAGVSDFTISFGKRPDHENYKIANGSRCSSSSSGGGDGESRSSREESWQISQCRCPDVNLELSLSTPAQQPQEETTPMRGGRKGKGSCFWSGASWNKDCCKNAFSGFESGFLEYTSIQMK